MKRNKFLNTTALSLLAIVTAGPVLAQTPDFNSWDTPDVPLVTAGKTVSLGNCPTRLLIDSWEITDQPLETIAVEAEVLQLCTERAEAIAGFTNRQVALNTALLNIQSQGRVVSLPNTDQVLNPYIETLTVEVDTLKQRIVQLEEGIQRPETEGRIEELRTELAIAQNQLDTEMALAAENSYPVNINSLDFLDETPTPVANNETIVSKPVAQETKPNWFEQFRENIRNVSEQENLTSPVYPPGAANAAVSLANTPPPIWDLLSAVRPANGNWRIKMQATRQVSITIPGLNDKPDTVRWQTQIDKPVTVSINDMLDDGRTVLAVTDMGVMLGEPNTEISEQDFIPFRISTTPGTLEWRVITEKDGQRVEQEVETIVQAAVETGENS